MDKPISDDPTADDRFLTYRRRTNLYRRFDDRDPLSGGILGLNKPSKSLFMQKVSPARVSYMDQDGSQKVGYGSSCSTLAGNKVAACNSCSPWAKVCTDSSLDAAA